MQENGEGRRISKVKETKLKNDAFMKCRLIQEENNPLKSKNERKKKFKVQTE